MATFDPRLTPTGDLKAAVRSKAMHLFGGDADTREQVERAMSDIPVDWDNLPDDGPFLAKLVSLVADGVRVQQEHAFF